MGRAGDHQRTGVMGDDKILHGVVWRNNSSGMRAESFLDSLEVGPECLHFLLQLSVDDGEGFVVGESGGLAADSPAP